jgi:hypothetical protein
MYSYKVIAIEHSFSILFWSQHIAGSDGLAQWLEEPTYPNTTLSWNLIHGEKMEVGKYVYSVYFNPKLTLETSNSPGSGMITQDISRSSTYYVAVGNLNTEEVEVILQKIELFYHNLLAW